MLDNRLALLFIRGERPIVDEKFDIMKHPNVKLSADGDGKPYIHGAVTEAKATICLEEAGNDGIKEEKDTAYLKLSDEQIKTIFNY